LYCKTTGQNAGEMQDDRNRVRKKDSEDGTGHKVYNFEEEI
jgi:hypothetical protein